MHKILVVRACAIGDFVLNLPALRALQQLHPDAQFTVVGYPGTTGIAREFVRVDSIHPIESPPWSRMFYEPAEIGLEFDLAIVWMRDRTFAENLRRSGMTNVLPADPYPAFGHASTHLLRTLSLPTPPLPDLWTPNSDQIIVHPGSGSPQKCWPFFDELMSRLPNATVLRGPAEGAADPLPLRDVSTLLRNSRFYIGNDSGITHLAAYLGAPTIALFGPTDPRIWGPFGRRTRIIWKRSLEEISVAEVCEMSVSTQKIFNTKSGVGESGHRD